MCLTTFMCDILWLFGNLHRCCYTRHLLSPTQASVEVSPPASSAYCLLLQSWQALLQIEFLQHQGPCRYRCYSLVVF